MSIRELKARHRAQVAVTRRPVVTVVGSGESADVNLCGAVGELIARLGYHLLTGGGRATMEEVSRAFVEEPRRAGLVIGVVPGAIDGCGEYEARDGYPNPWVELAVYTHLPDSGSKGKLSSSRNHINVLTADAVVALPGGPGTRSEIELATGYGVPLIAFGCAPEDVPCTESIAELEHFLKRHLQ